MEIYAKKFERLLAEQQERLLCANKELDRLPEGTLSQVIRNGKRTFFHITKEDGLRRRKSITQDLQMVGNLARKEYLKTEIGVLEQDIRLLEDLINMYVDPAADEILHRMPERLRMLPENLFFQAQSGDCSQTAVREWAANYKKSSYMAEKRTKTTSRGEKMRSMAEVAIAEIYYKHDIPFCYEAEITIGKYTVSVDFLGKRLRDGKLFYHEHCGMTGDSDYMKRHKWKLNLYEGAGIVPWDNLLITYNDAEGNIDMQLIESEITSRLL